MQPIRIRVGFTGADSMGHGGTCPYFYKCLGTGAPSAEQQTRDCQSVLTITKALTKTSNWTCGAKKVEGKRGKTNILWRVPSPTFEFVPAALVRFCNYGQQMTNNAVNGSPVARYERSSSSFRR